MINAERNRINKVLSNAEIQAMITAIGTGILDEFDVSKLRYHHVIVMTDADVDGSHIRTLILTFLYRNMRELVERGHVYLAVPPLYRVKLGNQELYVEKESQFEELLVRERVKDMKIVARAGGELAFTEARWGRFTRSLAELDGWLGRLRSDFGSPAADFVVRHRLIETAAALPSDVEGALAAIEPNGHDVTVLDGSDTDLRLKIVELSTSAAAFVDPARRPARLTRLCGPPPVVREARRDRRRAALRALPREEEPARGDVRGAPPPRPRAREGGHPGESLQGSRRDERRRAP